MLANRGFVDGSVAGLFNRPVVADFDWSFPYPSRRMPVLGRNVVATSQPLAAQAGITILAQGGNAVDAAIATAVTLTVVEPTNNGVGSDAFAILWDGRELCGLNASGRAPAAFTPERFRGLSAMPGTGWDSVTVPGAVSGWVELSRRFGRLPFERLFEPALRHAREGFPVSPVVAREWELTSGLYDGFSEFGRTFLPEGRPPRPGEIFRCQELAHTLEAIGRTEGEAFYRGELAGRIAAHSRKQGGVLTEDDLAAQRADWVIPAALDAFGVRLHEIPPNTQGIAALMALGIADRLGVAELPADSAEGLHLQIEAMKVALADVHRHVGDPAHVRTPVTELLGRSYLEERANLVDRERAGTFEAGAPGTGDTVYLGAADASGQMVSFIQSNYFGFGSGVVVPGTGISLQNRACGFTLEAGHPNQVGPAKRPFHTILPAFVTRRDQPLLAFGVMGGPMQPQGHLQMMLRIFVYGQNPQSAADAPRWQVRGGKEVAVEKGFAPEVLDGLRSRGHELTELDPALFGGAQLVWRLDDGVYLGASEPRKDGQAVAF